MSPPDGIDVEMTSAEASLPRQANGACDLPAGTDEIDRFDHARRRLLARLVAGAGVGLAGVVLGPPARADTALDVQILQTASSLETLAIELYGLLLGEGPDGGATPAAAALAGLPDVVAFARETRRHHAEHRRAFQLQTQALGGRAQDSPHPRFQRLVSDADLSTPQKVVDLAATIEKVATDTYLLNLAQLQDATTKALLAGVMAVEAQHLATMRVVGALLPANQAVAVPAQPADLPKLPSAIGQAAFPDALHAAGGPDLVADPASGALR